MPIDYITMAGIHVHKMRSDALVSHIISTIAANRRALIAGINADLTNLSLKQEWLRDFMNSCDIVFCDGFGVKWGAHLLGESLPERLALPDWFDRLLTSLDVQGSGLFFLGAAPGVAEEASRQAKIRYPSLRILGTHHGYFDKIPGSKGNDEVLRLINMKEPHVLLVGMGVPTQEQWLWQNWEHLDANVAIAAGAIFEYLAQTKRRPPPWMTSHGLEWLGRLVLEPARLWRRYLIGNPVFVWHLLGWRMRTQPKE